MVDWPTILDPAGAPARLRRAVAETWVDAARPLPSRRPLCERPLAVFLLFLSAALVAIPFIDVVALSMSGLVHPDWRPSLVHLTALGEGWEILVASGLAVIATVLVAPEQVEPHARAALMRVGAFAGFALAAVAGSGILSALVKNAIGRARPQALGGDTILEIHAFAFQAKYAAFPSGHSTTAGATAMVVALLWPRLRWPLLACGAIVALTRTLLEAHFPSDVIAGFGLGVAATLSLAHFLARRGRVFTYDEAGRLVVAPGEPLRHLRGLFTASRRLPSADAIRRPDPQ